jgi:hypothetical protein
LIIIAIIATVVLSQGDGSHLATPTHQSVSQNTIVPHPSLGEPGLVGKLVNTPFYPLAKLVKAHPVPSIIALVGFLTIIGVAITLGIVFSRPGEQVDVKNVVPGENELDQSGEGSFWQRNMWPLIGCGVLGLFALVVLIIIWVIKGSPLLWCTKTSSEPIKPVPTVWEKLKKLILKWNHLTEAEFENSLTDQIVSSDVKNKLIENVKILNEMAALKVPNTPKEGEVWPVATLTVSISGSNPYHDEIRCKDFVDLYVGLYSSVKLKDMDITYDYIILEDLEAKDAGLHKFYTERVEPYIVKQAIDEYSDIYDAINDDYNKLCSNFKDKDSI